MSSAVVFPGQGSQYIGMGKDLAEYSLRVQQLFDQANQVLGFSIADICFSGPSEQLKCTLFQQIAIFVVSAASWDVFNQETDVVPSFYAGLSLGEYSCLYAASVLDFPEGVSLIQKRAQVMEEAAQGYPACMMAVLGVDPVDLTCDDPELFYIANLNCPGQVVISLARENKEQVTAFLESKGAKRIVELDVSGGFHSPFMKKAEEKLRAVIEPMTFKVPRAPIVSNVDAQGAQDPSVIKEHLVQQLTGPVLWEKSVRFLMSQGVTRCYEVGPGKVLRGIMRKIDSSLKVVNFGSVQDIAFIKTKEKV